MYWSTQNKQVILKQWNKKLLPPELNLTNSKMGTLHTWSKTKWQHHPNLCQFYSLVCKSCHNQRNDLFRDDLCFPSYKPWISAQEFMSPAGIVIPQYNWKTSKYTKAHGPLFLPPTYIYLSFFYHMHTHLHMHTRTHKHTHFGSFPLTCTHIHHT